MIPMIKGIALTTLDCTETEYLFNHMPAKNAGPIYGIYVYLSETMVSPIDINWTTRSRLTIKNNSENTINLSFRFNHKRNNTAIINTGDNQTDNPNDSTGG